MAVGKNIAGNGTPGQGWLERLRGKNEIQRLTSSQVISETTGWVTTVGAVLVADKLAPKQMQKLSNFIARKLIAPYYSKVEWVMRTFPNLNHDLLQKHTDPATLTQEEKVKQISAQLSKVIIGGVTGFLANSIMQWKMDNLLKVQQDSLAKTMMIKLYSDEAPKLGSWILLNTAARAPARETMGMLDKIFRKLGIPTQKASDLSGLSVNWLVPEVIATAVNIAALKYNLTRKQQRDARTV